MKIGFIGFGADSCDSYSGIGRNCEVTILMLPNSSNVKDVVL